jgi:hypothetical protein
MKIKAIAILVMAFSFFACDHTPKNTASSLPKKHSNQKKVRAELAAIDTEKTIAKSLETTPGIPDIQRVRTDSPQLALRNFAKSIDAAEARYVANPKIFRRCQALASLHLKRARFLGNTASYGRAFDVGEATVKAMPNLGDAYLLRATTRSAMHLFQAALSDLTEAEKRGASKFTVARKRESIQVSLGLYKTVLPEWEKRAKDYPRWNTIARWATGLQEAGEYARADEAYRRAFEVYRETSPFIVAWIMFSRGLMWAEKADQPKRGKRFYEEALHYLPDYFVANIHLAELEAEEGQIDQAIARLERLQGSHKDPEIYGKLCAFYARKSMASKADAYCQKGLTGYNTLLKSYRAAFADHAAEFFMGPGKDPARALTLAQYNLSQRKTERARALLIEAALFAKQAALACDTSRKFKVDTIRTSRLRAAHLAGSKVCP